MTVYITYFKKYEFRYYDMCVCVVCTLYKKYYENVFFYIFDLNIAFCIIWSKMCVICTY